MRNKTITFYFSMPFKKLDSNIKEMLEHLEITIPTPFQCKSIPAIKSGANIFCTAPKNSGKTTTLILTTLHKLKCEAVGSTPRAIILVENDEKALELYNAFLTYTKPTSLRLYTAGEKFHIDLLKSEIFEGIDILISTPKTMNKLLLLEGINTMQVKLFCIDDADFLVKSNASADVISITQSIHKCQFVLYSEKMHPVLKRLESYFMEYAKIVAI
ncbi:RAD3-like DEAD/DEAH box helicase [Tenacibaculum adriaticum]|uniref:RAD3-like DEAD/DEAH box helicase n=1 Tax=Tenacibaculum adriaticum TaxID=413713 RepID=A0A5S5DUB0_9FLAO|nr:DEAD/DEAH box helicase [Tenacibaculum adriaticum]TYP98948.1 RAD3-like DEAD/DEAH box helicase [Tenacibaculum adriaticum]